MTKMIRTKWPPEVLYIKNDGVMRAIALWYAQLTGHEYDELKSECNLIFMHALDKWDWRRASFTTFLHQRLHHGLISFMRRYERMYHISNADGEHYNPLVETSDLTAAGIAEIRDLIDAMTPEAQEVVSIILSGPAELLDLRGNEKPKFIRGKLRRFLRTQGWTFRQINSVMREVRVAVNGV